MKLDLIEETTTIPTVLWPTTAQLEMHMDEILEESLRAATLMTQLKKLSHESEERDVLEGQVYARV